MSQNQVGLELAVRVGRGEIAWQQEKQLLSHRADQFSALTPGTTVRSLSALTTVVVPRLGDRGDASPSGESHPGSTWSIRANKAAIPSCVVGQSSSRMPSVGRAPRIGRTSTQRFCVPGRADPRRCLQDGIPGTDARASVPDSRP